jgi:methyl-accepting chemotaxis protein
MTSDQYVQRLQEIINKKKRVLQDILNQTNEQAKTITEDGLDNLKKNIDEKKFKIDEALKVDDEFNVYFQRFKQELKIKNLDELENKNITGIKELQQSIKQIMEIMNEISSLEKLNSDHANVVLNNIGDRIKKLNQGKTTFAAYKPGSVFQLPSYFIDKKK